MKLNVLLCGLFVVSAVSGYTATPSEFPGAFIERAQNMVNQATNDVQDLDALSGVISPIAAMSNHASLKTVRSNLAELERMTMSEGSSAHIDAIRLAGLFKLSVPLILKMNDRILDALSDIETLLSFWKEAQGYRVHFFLHRKSPKVIVGQLQKIQKELCALLGALVQQVNRAPFGYDRSLQYAWFKNLCTLLTNEATPKHVAIAQPVFETVAALLTRATTSVLGFTSKIDRRLYEYGKPSWVRRNLGTAVTTVVGGTAATTAAHQCKDTKGDRYVVKAAHTIAQNAKMYGDACADALWGDDQRWQEEIEEAERKERLEFKVKVSQLLPAFTRNNSDRDKLATELVRQRLLDLNVITTKDAIDLLHVQFDDDGNPSIGTRERSGSDASAAAAAAISDDSNTMTDLERVYCKLFGMKALPEPKLCAAQLFDRDESAFTLAAMNTAAQARDLRYFIPLVTQPVSVEGQDLAEGVKNVPKVLSDTELREAYLVQSILADAAKGTRVASSLVPSAPTPTTKRFTSPGRAVEAIAQGMNGKLEVLDTLAQVPDIVRFGLKVGNTDFNKLKFQYWKKIKLPLMIGIAYFLHSVCKDVVIPPVKYLLKKTKIIKYEYEGLFETLRELKKLLLVNGEKQQSEMDPCDVGLMYYLIYRLECVEVPAKYSATFLDDVRLLQSPDLSAKQKYKVVKDVLQEGYPFLRVTSETTK